jgi:gliding motility-associated-like protein
MQERTPQSARATVRISEVTEDFSTNGHPLDNSTSQFPVATPMITTLYTLIVTDLHGCQDTDWVNVTVVDDYIIIPDNVITPNGDGANDFWWIDNILTYPDNHVMIFNRYGNKVYESKGYSNGWDGSGLPNGTYYYVVTFDGSSRVYKGTITIIDRK